MKAVVTVMLKPGVLDPQGKAIGHALHTLGFAGVGEVRAGKVIELELAESDPDRATSAAEEMARKLLANTVIESFRVVVSDGLIRLACAGPGLGGSRSASRNDPVCRRWPLRAPRGTPSQRRPGSS